MTLRTKRILLVSASVLALSAVAAPQLREAIKVIGVGAAVKQFGPDINKAINRLSNHKDTAQQKTKVVPILSVGIGGGGSSIGAAQVTGPAARVDQVQAVAQPQTRFGDVSIRALIPVSSRDVIKNIRKVEGVGVSGIVDLRL